MVIFPTKTLVDSGKPPQQIVDPLRKLFEKWSYTEIRVFNYQKLCLFNVSNKFINKLLQKYA